MEFDQKLLEILACPQCKGDLQFIEDQPGLACPQCSLLFPIRDEVPIMLVDEALPFEVKNPE